MTTHTPGQADITTVADVQEFMSLGSVVDPDLLQMLVTNASAFVLGYLNRRLLSATYTETRNGLGGDRMVMCNTPITAVSSVAIDGKPLALSTSPHMFGYVFDASQIYVRGVVFPRGVQNVTISYTAGYAAYPAEVVQATIEIVAAKYKRRTNIEVSGKTLNGETISFVQSDMPKSAQTALASYIRVMYP